MSCKTAWEIKILVLHMHHSQTSDVFFSEICCSKNDIICTKALFKI